MRKKTKESLRRIRTTTRTAPQSRDTGKRSKPVACWTGRGAARRLVLANDLYRVELWPELGGAITSYVDGRTGLDIIWRNPCVQPPRSRVLDQPMGDGSDLYDVMDGSWYVSLPNGFFAGDYFGAPLGTHGELRAVPWAVEQIRSESGKLTAVLVGSSIRTPLVYRRELIIKRDSALMEWRETVENRSVESLPVTWLQHPTFGGPLLDGARLVTPAKTVSVFRADNPAALQLKAGYKGRWPFVPERDGGKMRDCSVVPPAGSGTDHSVQLGDFDAGWGCVWNETRQLGFAMEWELDRFPYAWSWNLAGGTRHYPLWGEGHLITLQPSTSPVGRFPDLLKRKEVLWVPGRGAVTTVMTTGFVNRANGPWKGEQ